MKSFKKIFLTLTLVFLCFTLRYVSVNAEITQEDSNSPASNLGIEAYTTTNLNLRQSIDGRVLTVIPCGETISVIDQQGAWFSVKYKNYSGFVSWKYIKFTEPEIEEDSDLIGNSIIHYKSSENRDINMNIACATINGIVIQPGEKFIWSQIVGQTTKEKGYKMAPVIVNRQRVNGLGGGVCQVSTTIYNATFDTEINAKAYSHSTGCAYAEKDATVAYGSRDFSFENSYDFPIRLEMYSYKGIVFCNIYRVQEAED